MDWEEATQIISVEKLVDLISLTFDGELSDNQKALINHLIKTEFLKYESVLSEVGDTLEVYQDDYSAINQILVKLNTGLTYLPKKRIV